MFVLQFELFVQWFHSPSKLATKPLVYAIYVGSQVQQLACSGTEKIDAMPFLMSKHVPKLTTTKQFYSLFVQGLKVKSRVLAFPFDLRKMDPVEPARQGRAVGLHIMKQ